MHVKGVAFLARETLISAEHGADKWQAFYAELQKREPFFRQPVLPVSRIPVELFLKVLDELVARFYGGNPETHWKFGISAGTEALTVGQLKGLFQVGEERKFLAFAPTVYKSYFDGGLLTSQSSGPSAVDLHITGTPVHPYFEGAVIGFARAGMEVLKAKSPVPTRVRGFASGDADILYRFTV